MKLRLAIAVVMLFLLILILPFFVSQVESGTSTNTLYAHAEGATIWTDKDDYGPEETVTIFGSGFLANKQVAITITAPDSSVATIYATTDESGAFTAYYTLDGMEGTYTVAATDGTNTATTTFTDTTYRYFTATISPNTAITGETKSYTITITNDMSSSSGVLLGSAKIAVPSGFTIISSLSVSYPSGKPWTATLVSGYIKLSATADSYRLSRGQSVSVTFSATAPGTAGTYTWTTSVWVDRSYGSGTAFTLKPGTTQPKVTVSTPPLNTPPVLDPIGPKTVDEMTTLSFTATASDTDLPPQTLTFSLGVGAPSGASITSGGAFSWTPTEAQGLGVYTIRIIVSDGSLQDYEDITVTVNEVNVAPVLDSIGPKSVNEGTTLSFTATATDADIPAQTLTFSLGPGAPAGASITSGGAFTWTPTEAQGPGSYIIRIIVSDGIDQDYEDITVIVNEVNTPPVLNPIGDKTVNEMTTLSFTTTASDSDLPAQTLTFSLGAGAPADATITAAGAFSWTPTEAQGLGSYVIRIIVSDGIAQDYEDITVTVNEVNLPPVLSPIGPKTVSVGNLLQFTVTASDSELPAQTLTYSASNLPPGATFDPNTHVFSWTPTSGQAGVYPSVHFEVSDGYLTDSEDITITVTAPAKPVGGYSISLIKQTPTSHITVYAMLIALIGAVLILTKRKRK